MTHQNRRSAILWLTCFAFLGIGISGNGFSQTSKHPTLPSVQVRFSGEDRKAPDFQKHVVPVLSRLGCNGRACHGSFQGRGGFQLSLFGYDFDADHRALNEPDTGRINQKELLSSLLLTKPSGEEDHGGGKRFEVGGWQYNLLKDWIEQGAGKSKQHQLDRLVVRPSEIVFSQPKQSRDLHVVAVWKDGSREDVTPLCRFQTNDSQIASVDANGKVIAGSAGDSHVVVFYDKAVVPVPILQAVSDQNGENYPHVSTPTEIDRLVVQKLRKLGIVPSELSDDATFLRRVSLDLTGTLPSPSEIRKFLANPSPSKRQSKIDELLDSSAYAAWWATKLNDFTGNAPRELNNLAGSQNAASRQWYQWIYQRVKENRPYDQIVEGLVLSTSRDPGESYYDYCQSMSKLSRDGSGETFAERESMPYYWMRRQFRDGNSRAISFAHSFLGIRIQCAQCHKHPFDQWTKQDFRLFAQMFTSVNAIQPNQGSREDKKDFARIMDELGIEGNRINGQLRQKIRQELARGATIPFPQLAVTPPRPLNRNAFRKRGGKTLNASVLGGEPVNLVSRQNRDTLKDPRRQLMNWLRNKDNPYFAKAFVNRVWANYFNVGIVSPTDDLNLANPPSNAALLDYLADGFVEHGYDMKWLHREIVNSRTYQRSWKPNETNRGDRKNFSRSIPRRLPAEVVYDAITLSTANDSTLDAAREELKQRAIFGEIQLRNPRRRNRSKSFVADPRFALSIFGASSRINSCDCDRSSDSSLLQTVYLKNDRDIHALMNRTENGWLAKILEESMGGDGQSEDIPSARQIQQLSRQWNQLRQRREQLVKNGDKKNQVEKVNRQMRNTGQKLKSMRAKLARATNPEWDQEKREQLIHSAYLRTLSRSPSDQELARCQKYFEQNDHRLNALRGIVWALLNTREFIVNH